MLEKLFNNETVKKLALGSLTKSMKENGISIGTFTLDAAGELDVQFYKEKMVLIPASEHARLTEVYTKYLLSLPQRPDSFSGNPDSKSQHCKVKEGVYNG